VSVGRWPREKRGYSGGHEWASCVVTQWTPSHPTVSGSPFCPRCFRTPGVIEYWKLLEWIKPAGRAPRTTGTRRRCNIERYRDFLNPVRAVITLPPNVCFGSNRQATARLGSRGVLKWRFNSLGQRPSSICITKENICQRLVCRLLVLHVLWFIYGYARVRRRKAILINAEYWIKGLPFTPFQTHAALVLPGPQVRLLSE
jgi:hypothetical protein